MKKDKCPYCGNTELSLCSQGGWNCPDCFNFVRMATPKERKEQIKGIRELTKNLNKQH